MFSISISYSDWTHRCRKTDSDCATATQDFTLTFQVNFLEEK